MKVLLVFVDGVGIGATSEYNPFTVADLPSLRALLGDVPVTETTTHARAGSLVPLDATLGVAGTPQSGTGQTTLFTGINAAALNGRHFGPWVPTHLRSMLAKESILARAVRAGLRVAFANAYPHELIQASKHDNPRRLPAFMNAGPPVAAIGAGVFNRDVGDLRSGNAVASEIVNDGWRERLGFSDLPKPTAEEAGHTLAALSAAHELTLFAHYATDTAGHEKDMTAAVAALERLDRFVGAVIAAIDDDTLFVMASDHGNIEDVRVGHTRNPALGIIAGPGHDELGAGMTSLLDVTPMIARVLKIE